MFDLYGIEYQSAYLSHQLYGRFFVACSACLVNVSHANAFTVLFNYESSTGQKRGVLKIFIKLKYKGL